MVKPKNYVILYLIENHVFAFFSYMYFYNNYFNKICIHRLIGIIVGIILLMFSKLITSNHGLILCFDIKVTHPRETQDAIEGFEMLIRVPRPSSRQVSVFKSSAHEIRKFRFNIPSQQWPSDKLRFLCVRITIGFGEGRDHC